MKILFFLFCSFFFVCSYSQSKQSFEYKTVPEPTLRIKEVIDFNQSLELYKTLSTQEKDLLYWTNLVKLKPIYFWDSVVSPILSIYPQLKGSNSKSLYRDLQRNGPQPMLFLHKNLIKASRSHSNDLATNHNLFSHTSTDGTSFGDRLSNFGVSNVYLAENISQGQQSILLSFVLLYLDIGVPDLGHRINLMNLNYTHIGIGFTQKANGVFYFTQDFSSKID